MVHLSTDLLDVIGLEVHLFPDHISVFARDVKYQYLRRQLL